MFSCHQQQNDISLLTIEKKFGNMQEMKEFGISPEVVNSVLRTPGRESKGGVYGEDEDCQQSQEKSTGKKEKVVSMGRLRG